MILDEDRGDARGAVEEKMANRRSQSTGKPGSRYSREFIDALKKHADIVVVIQNLGINGWSIKGTRDKRYSCPFCERDGSAASLKVWREPQEYFCSRCKLKGDVIQFIMDFYGISFPQAIENLAKATSFDAVWNHSTRKRVRNKSAV